MKMISSIKQVLAMLAVSSDSLTLPFRHLYKYSIWGIIHKFQNVIYSDASLDQTRLELWLDRCYNMLHYYEISLYMSLLVQEFSWHMLPIYAMFSTDNFHWWKILNVISILVCLKVYLLEYFFSIPSFYYNFFF